MRSGRFEETFRPTQLPWELRAYLDVKTPPRLGITSILAGLQTVPVADTRPRRIMLTRSSSFCAAEASRLYEKYRAYTMVPRPQYIDNLLIAAAMHNVPGDVVECGVWRGGMLAGIADVLGPDRYYYLYDSYQGLPKAAPIDGERALAWQSNKASPDYYDNCTAPEHVALGTMARSRARAVRSTKGWFSDTLFAGSHSAGIALLRLDADWYESTLQCLTALFPRVVNGGVTIVDDYYTWDGCTRAVHEYLAHGQHALRIRSTGNGVCYIVKQ